MGICFLGMLVCKDWVMWLIVDIGIGLENCVIDW